MFSTEMKIRPGHMLLELMVFLPFCTSAQSWTQTSAPSTNWSWIAASADGARLVATTSVGISNANSVWISTDAGSTWTPTSVPAVNNWYRVASSADGTRLAAAAYDGIYISADSGNTWAKTCAASWDWLSLAMSADGLEVVAQPHCDCAEILTSCDGGTTWASNGIPSATRINLACSRNGSKLVAAVDYLGGGSQIFTSTNMGASWEAADSPPGADSLGCIASSADGSTWVVGGGGIFVTTNSGATWIANNVVAFGGSVNWISCASSADGSTLVAVARSDNLDLKFASLIFTSTNFGISWTQADAPVKDWTCVASSADGHGLVGSASVDRFSTY